MALIAAHRVQSPALAMAETLAATDVSVSFERTRSVDSGGARLHFWACGADLDGFERTLRSDGSVSSVICLDDETGSEDGTDERLYSARTDSAATLASASEEFDATLLTLRYADDWWFTESRFPDADALDRYRTWLTDRDAAVRVDRVYVEDGDAGPSLTRRQRETVVLAYEKGFFEVPRDATLSDLAEEFDVSEQAISQRLRRAYSRLVAGNYGD
jgi:predicted DNA binding protein